MTVAPFDFAAHARRLTSQSGEDGILAAIFDAVGETDRRAVEVACGGNGGNAGGLIIERSFSGLLVDGDAALVERAARRFARYPVRVMRAWVTRESIDALLAEHGITGEIDYFGLDLDGNDYWVWEAMTAVRPRVVVTEYNAALGPDRAVTIAYNPAHRWRKGKGPKVIYWGASLPALASLGARKGYRLIAVEPNGVNAFWLREDVAPQIPGLDPREAWQPTFVERFMARAAEIGDEEIVAYFAHHGLPLVDVS